MHRSSSKIPNSSPKLSPFFRCAHAGETPRPTGAAHVFEHNGSRGGSAFVARATVGAHAVVSHPICESNLPSLKKNKNANRNTNLSCHAHQIRAISAGRCHGQKRREIHHSKEKTRHAQVKLSIHESPPQRGCPDPPRRAGTRAAYVDTSFARHAYPVAAVT